jgi:hypothetical protein
MVAMVDNVFVYLCLNCLRPVHVGVRPRSLCRKCHDNKRIRCQYEAAPTSNRDTTVLLAAGFDLPLPTEYRPGTAGKVRVLMERYASGKQLWHPSDAK